MRPTSQPGLKKSRKRNSPMVDILNLALPYFGLIFIGFACGKAKGLPEAGLAAALHIHPPVAIDNTLLFLQNAAAPTALFVLGVTGRAAPARPRALGSARRHRGQTAGPSAGGFRASAAARAVRAHGRPPRY